MEYRSQLEVMKWTAPRDVLQHCSEVCLAWLRSCDSSELWLAFLDDAGVDNSANPEHLSYKQCYSYYSSRLVLITSSALQVYYPMNESWREVTLTADVTVDKSSGWADDGTGGWICCGGGAGTSCDHDESNAFLCAYRISPRGAVTRLLDMQTARKWHGMLTYKGVCYVFGGVGEDDNDTAKCEKMKIGNNEWETISPMHSVRSSFNPCLYRDMIYLMLGKSSRSEVFDPMTGTFIDLPISLYLDHSTMVVTSNQIFVLTSSKYFSGTTIEALGEKPINREHSYVWGNMSPIAYQNGIYIPQSYNRFSVLKVELSTMKCVKFSPEPKVDNPTSL